MSWFARSEPRPSGYWGPITSTLLWCERKYTWSYYVAEPVNTFTNFMFLGYAAYMFYLVRRERLPARFLGCCLGMGSVGLGSFLFHMTLKYEAQLLDELPMIWAAGFVSYSLLEDSPGYTEPRYGAALPASIFALILGITVTYIYNGNPVFHQVAYALIFTVTCVHALFTLFHPASRMAQTESARRNRSIARRWELIGIVSFGTGFAVWNVDNVFCSTLRAARDLVGYPWAVLLEGHGWWHILTCEGVIYLLAAAEVIVLSLKEHPDNIRVHGGLFPWVERVRPYSPDKTLSRELERPERTPRRSNRTRRTR